MASRLPSSAREPRRTPSARTLLLRFGIVGITLTVLIVSVLAVALVRVLADAQDDIDHDLETAVLDQLDQSSGQQAQVIGQELAIVHRSADYLRLATAEAYDSPIPPPPAERARYRQGADGGWYTPRTDDGLGAALWYSSITDVGDKELDRAASLSAIDPALRAVVDSSTLVTQAYLNTADSMNRIYPYFDTEAQFPPGLDVTTYSFYYEADETNNPAREVVWTEVYKDPAGLGWMVSAIAPVYAATDGGAEELQGVVGLDVTVSSLIGELLSGEQAFGGYTLLLDQDGVIMAMPPAAEEALGLTELTDVDYATFVTQDIFKSADFDVTQRADTAELAALLATGSEGRSTVSVAGRSALVAFNTLPATGWRVVTLAETSRIDQLNRPAEHLRETVTLVIVLLGIAAVLLVALLTWRARSLSVAFTQPLMDIDDATNRIAQGEFRPVIEPAPVAELERTRNHVLEMGARLEAAQEQMLADAERLRENEERYRTIFENVAQAVVTIDGGGVITEANEAAAELIGTSAVGRSASAVLATESWRQPGHHIVTVAHGAQGAPRTLDLNVARWGDGSATRYVITVRDVTADEERERLLQQARATAERTARLKDDFLASMSHEIRTPLNGVLGMLSLVEDEDVPSQVREKLDIARRSASDLLVLVNDVLDISRLEADQVAVVPDDVSLGELVDSVIALFEPLAAEQGDSLGSAIDPSVPEFLHVDPTRLRQVLVNLVGNALKFTEAGNVRISASFTPSPAPGHPGTLRMEVTDDGIGIPAELQSRLFTRFSQGNPLSARKFRGTGLGLAIVKRLVELMGGTVGVRSREGAGSTFWFTIDADPGTAPVAADHAAVAAAPTAGRSLRVLVAEDNEVNQLLFVKMLERLGHRSVTVDNGSMAVEAVQREHFDVVLMDVQMPVLSGIEATRVIRSLPGEVSHVPILAITANVLDDQRQAYEDAGMSGILPKPLTVAELAAGLAAV